MKPYKLTIHEEVQKIEFARLNTAECSWIILEVTEEQRQKLQDAGYNYVCVLPNDTGNKHTRHIAFTWLKDVADWDRCRKEVKERVNK